MFAPYFSFQVDRQPKKSPFANYLSKEEGNSFKVKDIHEAMFIGKLDIKNQLLALYSVMKKLANSSFISQQKA
jgi:hypothetical protein